MVRLIFALTALCLIISCSSRITRITDDFGHAVVPPEPDYSRAEHWASLPTRVDAADRVPRNSGLQDAQASASADVFFIYPTIFTQPPTNAFHWNADVNDEDLNKQIQESTILNQASIFNGSCRIYAPYYRQAHLYAFYTPNRADGEKALQLAYEDVKKAFVYYLKNFNQGRPIVIAAHSQGSYHGMRLLKDFFEGKELKKQLVAAYLIGRAIHPDEFTDIRPTEHPDDVGVWASWNTFGAHYYPANYAKNFKGALSINPLSWSADEVYTPRILNRGGVVLGFRFVPQLVDAQNHQGLLWVHRPHVAGSFLLGNKNWHRADLNFFYMNVRENVARRVAAFARLSPK